MRHVNDIDDRLSRLVGIPGFGLVIPHVAGLFGPIGPRDPRFWVGTAAFVALAWAIWEGNRWLLFRQRERLDWFTAPLGKVAFMVVGCVFYTAPLTGLAIAGWYTLAGLELDRTALTTVVLVNVICVLVVTHVYETAFLVKARHQDRALVERLEQTRAEAELAALRAQIDPHFLFNSLNTLRWLIERDPPAASTFTSRLAQVYRYILATRERELVQLTDELAFVDDCVHLLRERFGDALIVEQPAWDPAEIDTLLLPPISLQLLLENAVKHNAFSASDPLRITIALDGDVIVVTNDLRPRSDAVPSEGLGLANLAERYRLLLDTEIEVNQPTGAGGPTQPRFEVRLPLARVGGALRPANEKHELEASA